LQIQFRTKKLEKQYTRHLLAIKAYGSEVARKYVQRINIIKQTKDYDELSNLPGLKCHPLKGDREGQYAISLTGFYRLIFTLVGESLEILQIEEVSKHYDD
jgi:proteic killer suppression protein